MKIPRVSVAAMAVSSAPRGLARSDRPSLRASPPAVRASAGIINGRVVRPGEFPYTISLQCPGGSYCGGALIARDVVLSAAHCRKIVKGTVVAGRQDLASQDGQVLPVLKQVPHPQYKNGAVRE